MVTTKNTLPVPTESQEQINLFRMIAYSQNLYPELNFLYHVPNGGFRNKATAGKLKAEGVKSGVPDLCLPAPRYPYHGLYVEMKRTKGGQVSKDQREWLDFLKSQNYKIAVAKGCDEAFNIIMDYIKLPLWPKIELS